VGIRSRPWERSSRAGNWRHLGASAGSQAEVRRRCAFWVSDGFLLVAAEPMNRNSFGTIQPSEPIRSMILGRLAAVPQPSVKLRTGALLPQLSITFVFVEEVVGHFFQFIHLRRIHADVVFDQRFLVPAVWTARSPSSSSHNGRVRNHPRWDRRSCGGN
jgi:hypothetical protein